MSTNTIRRHTRNATVRKWVGLLLLMGAIGCGLPEATLPPGMEKTTANLDRIETIRLEEQSRSEPVTIEQATEQLAREVTEPNEARPAVELTLEEVRAAALADNLDLKVELVDPAIAQQSVDAERAKFEWAFFGSGQYARSESTDGNDTFSARFYDAGIDVPLQTGGSITTGVQATDADPVADAAVSVSYIQSLLRGAGTRVNTYPIQVAALQKGVVDASTKLMAIFILGDADIAYWDLYAARKDLDVRREQYKLAQDQLEHARRKVASGSAAKIEIVRAEAGLAGRFEDVINAETGVRDRERDLKRIMNRPDLPVNSPTGIIPLTEPDPRGLDLDPERLVEAALANRMEMAQLELNLALDDIDVELARNDKLPRLTFEYSYAAGGQSRRVGSALESIFDGPSEDHTVGLSTLIPLGNRAAEARFRQARLQRVRTQISQEQLRQRIRQQVYQAVDGLQQNWRRILAADQGTVAAYRDYKVEQSQFQLGVRTSTDVLLAASRLADAQLRRIRAFAEYEIAQVRLAGATGTLLGHGCIQLEPVVLEGK
jgi:outer membrane protein